MEKSKDTQEGNKLIGEFDGFEFITDAPLDYPNGYWLMKDENYGNIIINDIDDFRYDEDWNWLMVVLNKIEAFGFDVWMQTAPVEDGTKGTQVTIYNGQSIVTMNRKKNRIDAAWNAVLDFIKWYNPDNEKINTNNKNDVESSKNVKF